MNEVTEWSCSEWIMSDDLFLHIGRYWYPLHITQIVECVGEVIKIIVDAFSKLAEAIRQSIHNFMDTLPDICIAEADDGAEQYETQLRTRWKPVRYIRASDRRPDRRPPVYCIRSALSPNRKKDRRTGRKAIT